MIISHKYQFIFIKTNKTAGTSLEIALSKFCGDDDILTPIGPIDEMLRKKLGHRGAQNYITNGTTFHNHDSATKIKAFIGDKTWNTYYKFCFERNPCERIISFYYWRNKRKLQNISLSQFIYTPEVKILRNKGFDLYTINGNIAIDKVYLYEDLDNSLKHIEQILNLPHSIQLPQAKSGFRHDKRTCDKIFSSQELKYIRNQFQEEVRLFGY
jgi:hypothetical protein